MTADFYLCNLQQQSKGGGEQGGGWGRPRRGGRGQTIKNIFCYQKINQTTY